MKKILAFVLLLAAPCLAQQVVSEVRNQNGKAVQATVRVCSSATVGTNGLCTSLSSIYSEATLSTAKDNPFQSGSSGEYDFYATAGTTVYVQVYGPSLTTTTPRMITVPGGGSGGITNGAGANVLMKSNGTNAVASSVSDDGSGVSTALPILLPRTLGGSISTLWRSTTGLTGRGPFVWSAYGPTFNTDKDPVACYGYNFTADGVPVVAGEGGLGLCQEGYYNDGVAIRSEWYIQTVGNDGTTAKRPIFVSSTKSTGAVNAVILNSPNVTFNDGSGSREGGTTLMTLTPGSGLIGGTGVIAQFDDLKTPGYAFVGGIKTYSGSGPISVLTGAGASAGMKVGSLVASDSYTDSAPTNGIYSKGDINIGGGSTLTLNGGTSGSASLSVSATDGTLNLGSASASVTSAGELTVVSCTGCSGSATFSGLTAGTNNSGATMVVTSPSSLSGAIDSATLQTHAASYFQVALGYTPLNPANNLTDVANAATARASLAAQASLGSTPTTVSAAGTAAATKVPVYVAGSAPVNMERLSFDGTDWQHGLPSLAPNAQTGDYAILGMDSATPDLGKVITSSKGTAAAWTITQAGVGSPVKFPSGFFFWVKNIGVGTVTITATTSKFLISTAGGSSTLVVLTGQQCLVSSNGTDYVAQCTPAVDATGVLTSAQLPATSTVGTLFSVAAQATGIVSASGVQYFPVSGYSAGTSSEFSYEASIGAACTARNATLVTNSTNGVGTLTVTLRNGTTSANMADTALVISVGSGAVAGEFHDTTHTVSLAAGSMVTWKASMSANTSAQILGIGFQCN